MGQSFQICLQSGPRGWPTPSPYGQFDRKISLYLTTSQAPFENTFGPDQIAKKIPRISPTWHPLPTRLTKATSPQVPLDPQGPLNPPGPPYQPDPKNSQVPLGPSWPNQPIRLIRPIKPKRPTRLISPQDPSDPQIHQTRRGPPGSRPILRRSREHSNRTSWKNPEHI